MGKKHIEVAITLSDLEELYRETNQFSKAEKAYLAAIAIAKNSLPKEIYRLKAMEKTIAK